MTDEQPHLRTSPDDGLDLHAYRSEWASLEEEIDDDPVGALPVVRDWAERLLHDAGYAIHDPVASEGEDHEVVVEFREAARVALVAGQGGDLEDEDVADAIEFFRDLNARLLGDDASDD
jgi:hypothetical protein